MKNLWIEIKVLFLNCLGVFLLPGAFIGVLCSEAILFLEEKVEDLIRKKDVRRQKD